MPVPIVNGVRYTRDKGVVAVRDNVGPAFSHVR